MSDAAIAAWKARPGLVSLRGAVQHYPWGGYDFIPGLTGEANPGRTPAAELWIGSHPRAPAIAIVGDQPVSLDRLVARAPVAVLGDDAARFGGRLPFLLKVLDVRQMLSIQAHPAREQAREGFARENAAGIDLDDPRRTYRDDSHKPELHVALTDFWMLHGFRPLEQIADTLATVPGLQRLAPGLDADIAAAAGNPQARREVLRTLYRRAMTAPQLEVDAMLEPAIASLERAPRTPAKDLPGYWVLQAAREFPLPEGHRDRGMLSLWLLNLVRLRPGQSTFQPPGTLHAYLEGVDVEVMANSDNVLRGGLTNKHVDVEALLAALSFEDGPPPVTEGRPLSATERLFEAPVDEFALSRIEVSPGQRHESAAGHGAACIIALEGEAAAVGPAGAVALRRGGICLAPAGVPYRIEARTPGPRGTAVLFAAAVPREPR